MRFRLLFAHRRSLFGWTRFIRELEDGRATWFAEEYRGAEPGPAERRAFARVVLDNTQTVVDQYRSRYDVLPRWLSVELTALLLHKVSCLRGGGPQGTLSAGRRRELLSNPVKMARHLRESKMRARLFAVEIAELERERNPT